MIWWPFIKEHEFIMQSGEKKIYNLTEGFSIENAGTTFNKQMKINIVGGSHRTQITRSWDAAIVKIKREKGIITVSINNSWSEKYYIKTPLIWKSK